MFASHRFTGLDLPVWQAAERRVECNLHRLATEPSPDNKRCLRTLALMCFSAESKDMKIGRLLRHVDEELGLAAELTGSQVVDHQWGLYDYSTLKRRYRDYLGDRLYFDPETGQDDRLPNNHMLVADIAVLDGVAPLSDEADDLRHGVEAGIKTYDELTDSSPIKLSDMRLPQFVKASHPDRPGDDAPTLWLVDIEPRVH